MKELDKRSGKPIELSADYDTLKSFLLKKLRAQD
jgi:hypothetical protein